MINPIHSLKKSVILPHNPELGSPLPTSPSSLLHPPTIRTSGSSSSSKTDPTTPPTSSSPSSSSSSTPPTEHPSPSHHFQTSTPKTSKTKKQYKKKHTNNIDQEEERKYRSEKRLSFTLSLSVSSLVTSTGDPPSLSPLSLSGSLCHSLLSPRRSFPLLPLPLVSSSSTAGATPLFLLTHSFSRSPSTGVPP
ncbi:hypothetical protein RJT34_25049 [Clitoria ternatea]|uniref:Uncharacterized protein n=1 Tax=Clitoria ternatea TaxID=43366 RepID=A0AAN9FP14_CLITE